MLRNLCKSAGVVPCQTGATCSSLPVTKAAVQHNANTADRILLHLGTVGIPTQDTLRNCFFKSFEAMAASYLVTDSGFLGRLLINLCVPR